MKTKSLSIILFTIFTVFSVSAQTTEFTYQGVLNNGVAPATGNYDFEFRLFDAVTGGTQLGPLVTRSATVITDGRFAVNLDFGNRYNGEDIFLEIRVRPAGSGAYTMLDPRQRIRSTPYSVRSLSAAASETATNAHNLGGVAASQYVLTGDARLSDARNPLPGSANYIQNTTIEQASSNFNISGNGFVGGNVAIGTYNPQAKLHAEGGSGIGVYGASTGYSGVYGYSPSSGDGVTGFSIGGRGVYGSTNTGWAGFFSGKAHISDRLGIGTTNPTRSLEVAGTVLVHPTTGNSVVAIRNRFNSNVSQTVFYDEADTYRGYIGYIGSNAGLGGRNDTVEFGSNAKPITFRPADTEVMRLTATGRVGIGTAAPTSKLFVYGGSLPAVHATSENSTAVTGVSTSGNGVFGSSSSGYGVYGSSTSNYAGYFDGDVYVGNWLRLETINTSGSTDNYLCYSNAGPHLVGNCTSSLRYKTDVQTFSGGLNIINRLRPIAFNWKEDGTSAIGLAAEEVEKVEPLLTFRNDNGEIQGVKYNRISAVLINAVKEQQAQIQQMRRTIGIMQKEIKRLRAGSRRHLGRSGKQRRN